MAESTVCLNSRMRKQSTAQVGTTIITDKKSISTPPPSAGGWGIGGPPHKVAVRFADIPGGHNSPFYSVKSFEDLGLSTELLEGIYFMNVQKPSKIQERALPLLLSDPPNI
ncbi:hypothetical protein HOY82DRAFT_650415 [Tuber indicum]|nr:hypothetical protein HOY82DRAFT_650415 [Tuber indicum]